MGISLAAALEPARVSIGWHTRTPAKWDFDLRAIARACEHLGVEQPVVVGCAEYANGRWAGMYSNERGTHKIRVRRSSSAHAASRTLWHELTHAAQHERGDSLDTGISASRASRLSAQAYNELPGEAEAKYNERLHARMFPLTRPRG